MRTGTGRSKLHYLEVTGGEERESGEVGVLGGSRFQLYGSTMDEVPDMQTTKKTMI